MSLPFVMISEQVDPKQLAEYGPYLMMGLMWLILFVAIYKSLAHSPFGEGATRGVIAFCAASLAMYGGYRLYAEAALPAYVAMGMVILLGIAGIIRGGFRRIQRDSRRMQSDNEDQK